MIRSILYMEISKIIEFFYLKQSWCLKDQSWSENPTLHENICTSWNKIILFEN